MEKQTSESTHEKNVALKAAYLEKPFPASDIIEELAPLLSDYFEGDFIKTKDNIIMLFHNGQKFELSVSEI